MKELYELKDKLCDELKSYGKKDLTASTLSTVKDLTKTAYYLGELIENEEEDGYSNDYDRYNRNSYGRRESRRESGRNMRRESRRNSYDDGYSNHGDMVEELREMMGDARDERTRQELQKFINKMEGM